MTQLQRVEVWAKALINLHLDNSWSFKFDNAKTRAGSCNFSSKTITVSKHLAEKFSDDDIHQVLLHEVAHALAGQESGHNKTWRAIADELGYIGGTTHNGPIASEYANWLGSCPNGHKHYRYRKPTRESSCRLCHKSFSKQYLITWRYRQT